MKVFIYGTLATAALIGTAFLIAMGLTYNTLLTLQVMSGILGVVFIASSIFIFGTLIKETYKIPTVSGEKK